jgi:DNA invertase Pin-like site-specific DNA recombinase
MRCFRELVGQVCEGRVGAILGLEISRLARSSADLSRLLELARLTDTLVIDADGVYDLGDSTTGCCWASKAPCPVRREGARCE